MSGDVKENGAERGKRREEREEKGEKEGGKKRKGIISLTLTYHSPSLLFRGLLFMLLCSK